MPSFFGKIKLLLPKKRLFDAEIIGEAQLTHDYIPYFTVKMHGCNIPVNINAEDIIDKFIDKFSQNDIKNATKAYMKNRNSLVLVNIQCNYAIFLNKIKGTYEMIDASHAAFVKNIDLDSLKSRDIFKLGVHFKKLQIEKDRKLFELTKSETAPVVLKVVK